MKIHQLADLEDLVATLGEVERRLACAEPGRPDLAEVDVLELESLVDLALGRDVA